MIQTKYFSLLLPKLQWVFLLIVLPFFLSNCADSPNIKQVKKVSSPQQKETAPLTAIDYVEEAQNNSTKKASSLLITASKLYLEQGDSNKSLWLANKVSQLPLSDLKRYEVHLLKAQLLLNDAIDKSEEQLELAHEVTLKENSKIIHTAQYFSLIKLIADTKNDVITASEAALLEFSLLKSENIGDELYPQKTAELWLRLSSLSSWELAVLKNNHLPFIDGWSTLINYAQLYGLQPYRFSSYLAQWQRKYPLHPAQSIIPMLKQSFEHSEATAPLDNIAVLLPLTGKNAAYGKVIQEGILAAYDHKSNQEITFFDANSLDYLSLPDLFSEQGINHVIGPLLKNNVAKYLALENNLIPTLLLNVPETSPLPEHIFSLSMKPEDEAIQAATTLSQFDYSFPLVFAHNDSKSKRVAQSFAQQWRDIKGITPEIAYFDEGRSMQWKIKESLGVNASKQRINNLNKAITPAFKIKNKRSRRDIDMIYAIGNLTQIKLLKPYVDVNVSPFANIIPMYANSRSHSSIVDEATSRDLSGLVFAEMPWLLNSKRQNTALSKISKNLWPTRPERFQLFFALGLDSYHLIQQLPQMSRYPYLRYFGQTGTLKLTQNIISRSLLWGQFVKNKEKHIVLE